MKKIKNISLCLILCYAIALSLFSANVKAVDIDNPDYEETDEDNTTTEESYYDDEDYEDYEDYDDEDDYEVEEKKDTISSATKKKWKNSRPVITKVKGYRGYYAKVKIKKVKDAVKYEIQYSKKKNFKGKKTKTIKSNSFNLYDLDATKYYCKVRVIYKSNIKSKWSKVKTFTPKCNYYNDQTIYGYSWDGDEDHYIKNVTIKDGYAKINGSFLCKVNGCKEAYYWVRIKVSANCKYTESEEYTRNINKDTAIKNMKKGNYVTLMIKVKNNKIVEFNFSAY